MRGGDIFELLQRADGSAVILIADISSKGALSVVHTELMRRAFRMCATTERSPAAMMSMLNRLRYDGPPPNHSVTFAAAIIVAVERGAMLCRYASAGHDIGLFVRGRSHRHLVPTGPVLGVFPDAVYVNCLEPFGDGDVLILATDGFTECRSDVPGSLQFGTTGIARAAGGVPMDSCIAISRSIARCADEHTGGHYRDDATLAVIARNDGHGNAA
jgi:sigma-B regulation protein RsbU (phosphoserine phosphatase)